MLRGLFLVVLLKIKCCVCEKVWKGIKICVDLGFSV